MLAEPHRRQILDLLRDDERAVNDLVHELGISQPNVSKHLRVLRDAGLVAVRTDAQRRLYRLRPEPLARDRRMARAVPRRVEQAALEARATPRRDGLTRWRTDMGDLGVLTQAGDDVVLTFTRRFNHPAEKVWRAVTEEEHLATWFPQKIKGEWRAGAPLRFESDGWRRLRG